MSDNTTSRDEHALQEKAKKVNQFLQDQLDKDLKTLVEQVDRAASALNHFEGKTGDDHFKLVQSLLALMNFKHDLCDRYYPRK